MPVARLTDRTVLVVTGPEATAFLQGLVTSDVTKLTPGASAYAALLTPQGKIVTDFLVHAVPDGFHLDVPAAAAVDLLKRLKLYRLRAKIDLTDLTLTHAVFAAFDPPPFTGEGAEGATPDPRLPALGHRWIAPLDSPPTTRVVAAKPTEGASATAPLAAYHAHRLALGVPDSADTAGQFALDANLEDLHGLDFKKGCYVGQEVTARMKHKAAPRRRLAPVAATGDLPPPGTPLTAPDGTEIGQLVTGIGRRAIASIRLDRLAAAPGTTFNAPGGPAFTVELPAYPLPALTAALAKTAVQVPS